MREETGYYDQSLDGLRFFSFLLIFVHNFLKFSPQFNGTTNPIIITIKNNGWIGVDMFFILSGYLITLLALKERQKFRAFSAKNFLLRRGLRIIPLYYLVLIIIFFGLPPLYKSAHLYFTSLRSSQALFSYLLPSYLFFLGNWAVIYNYNLIFKNIAHLWTISLEMQFYLIWPLLFYFMKDFRRGLIINCLIIILAISTRLILNINGAHHPAIYQNSLARFDTFGFGSMIALLYFYKINTLKKVAQISRPFIVIVVLASFLIYLYQTAIINRYFLSNGVFGFWVVDVFFCYVLILAVTKSFYLLRVSLFADLGKISYGLYIWQIMAMELSAYLLKGLNLIWLNLFLALLITLVLAFSSYYLLEIHFLKMKTKYSFQRLG